MYAKFRLNLVKNKSVKSCMHLTKNKVILVTIKNKKKIEITLKTTF